MNEQMMNEMFILYSHKLAELRKLEIKIEALKDELNEISDFLNKGE